jgi:hypothetical protein|tara:strand:+ start:140 stop:2149 length:2010 start_codon:yes stop_codon:yes gene_type:complete
MENIECLVWDSELAIGEDGNALVSRFLKKACELLEAEINAAGGVAKQNLTINYMHVPKGDEGVAQVLQTLESSPNILFLNGHIDATHNKKILGSLDLDSLLFFKSAPGPNHPNYFNISRASKKTKSESIKSVLNKYGNDTRIKFIHDGKRMVQFETDFLSPERHNVSSINFAEFTKEDEIEKKLGDILPGIKDDDILILDVGLRVFKHIFHYLNETGKQPLVLKLFGSIGGRFERIGFPLLALTANFDFPYLDFEELIQRVDVPLTEVVKDLVKDSSWRLEIPLLIAYASKQAKCNFTTKEKLLEDLSKSLNNIDGERDIFVGKQLAFAFHNNTNTLKTNYLYQFPPSLQTDGSYPKIFNLEQFFPEREDTRAVTVNFLYIDVIRVTNVNIGDGTWGCEFYIDIVSPHDNPIEIITFDNLSSVNPKFEEKLIWEKHANQEKAKSCRYYVVANFDFNPLADNYPFDLQHVFISFSITDQNRYGIIQPIPEVLLDRDFQIDGWNLNEATSGVLRKKETIYEGTNLIRRVDIREEARIGWTLSRANSVTLMKTGIPLSFLLFLNYYTLFRGFGDIGHSVVLLTTAFLSGIALYFSTERPQPLRMTTVDLIFLCYYVLTGVTIVAASVSSLLGEKIFIAAMTGLKTAVPVGVIGIVAFLIRRIKSNRLKPRIN